MQNFPIVQGLEPPDDLYENVPYFLFLNVGLALLVTAYLLKDVSVVGILHYEAIKKVK